MKHKERMHASLATCVMLDAMIATYVEGLTFTVKGFCARYGYVDNRHVRAALNLAVKSGYLIRHKAMFSDRKYRYQYAAQLTRKLGI